MSVAIAHCNPALARAALRWAMAIVTSDRLAELVAQSGAFIRNEMVPVLAADLAASAIEGGGILVDGDFVLPRKASP